MEKGRIEFNDPNYKRYEETARRLGKSLGIQSVTIEVKPSDDARLIQELRVRLREAERVIDHYADYKTWPGEPAWRSKKWYEDGGYHGYDKARMYKEKFPKGIMDDKDWDSPTP